MDLFSRKIVGWSARPTIQREFALDALLMAERWRCPGGTPTIAAQVYKVDETGGEKIELGRAAAHRERADLMGVEDDLASPRERQGAAVSER
jgi:hypothetical protein